MNVKTALDSGRLANLEAVAVVRQSRVAGGAAEGMRAIDAAVWDGISLRIYPDRGLDLGQAWYRGIPLAWVSAVGEAPPLKFLEGMRWSEAFGGGLMATCGLRNVGMPSEGHGLHGTYSHLPATDVTVERVVTNREASVVVQGQVIDDAAPGPLHHQRTIRIEAGTGRIEIVDKTVNNGDETAAVPLLYHFNFGYPLWSPGAELAIPARGTTARDPASEASLRTWERPLGLEVGPERVLEHDLGEEAEWGSAVITNEALDLAVELRWDRSELPRLNQWIDPNPGMSVLGIEPANCGTLGRAFERKALTLPTLPPGGSRTTRLSVQAVSLSSQPATE